MFDGVAAVTPEDLALIKLFANRIVVCCDKCHEAAAFQCGGCCAMVCAAHKEHGKKGCDAEFRDRQSSSSMMLMLIAEVERLAAERQDLLSIIAEDSSDDECTTRTRVTRTLRIGDVRASAELVVETWDDGVLSARIHGTSQYGEGADVEAAVTDLEEKRR